MQILLFVCASFVNILWEKHGPLNKSVTKLNINAPGYAGLFIFKSQYFLKILIPLLCNRIQLSLHHLNKLRSNI